ncbi:SNF7 family protein [Cryptosporidium andersoni]|uniref:SNF7 family protein n=1 Tax=Cryptosporidium andersoni TaxID=117008 RepID=A0A1J4MWL6_9CRYT|nr:SNF7 family protein [Cryptosporidium andersoni]
MFFFRKKTDNSEGKCEVDVDSAREKTLKATQALEQTQKELEEKELKLEQEAAKLALQGDKSGAIMLLKRKKLITQEKEKLANSHLLLEQQLLNLETIRTQQMTMSALSAGMTAQQSISSCLNTNKLEKLSETIKEQQDLQDEISQVLTQSLPTMNEEELLEELSAIQAQEIDKKIIESSRSIFESLDSISDKTKNHGESSMISGNRKIIIP